MPSAYLLDLPTTEYTAALALQHAAVAARKKGDLDRDLLILVEHPPVFTTGRRGGRDNLLVPEAVLRQRGIVIVPVERGGDITFHNPGQLVVYPIIDLGAAGMSVVAFVTALELAMVRTAARLGVRARGNTVHRGAWVGRRKLGSLGITVRRGISFHGMALNVNNELEPFSWINPCGIPSCRITSLASETGTPVDMGKVRRLMTDQLRTIFDWDLEPIAADILITHCQGQGVAPI